MNVRTLLNLSCEGSTFECVIFQLGELIKCHAYGFLLMLLLFYTNKPNEWLDEVQYEAISQRERSLNAFFSIKFFRNLFNFAIVSNNTKISVCDHLFVNNRPNHHQKVLSDDGTISRQSCRICIDLYCHVVTSKVNGKNEFFGIANHLYACHMTFDCFACSVRLFVSGNRKKKLK